MHLRCPHCKNPIEVVDLPASGEVTCTSCGSSFRLEEISTTAWDDFTGKRIGKFEVVGTLGRGAFGVVLRKLGLYLRTEKPADLADKIMQLRLRFVLITALDHLLMLTEDEDFGAVLLETARIADPSPWRANATVASRRLSTSEGRLLPGGLGRAAREQAAHSAAFRPSRYGHSEVVTDDQSSR